MSMQEMSILREFILEFSTIYTEKMLKQMNYQELVNIVKFIAKEM